MKSIYPLAMLALAASFSSCSSDDNDNPYIKGDTDKAISFSNPFIDNSVSQRTKAEPTTAENLEGFKVWGFVQNPASVVFDGAEVRRNGSGWNISEVEYWYLGQPYWFTAISTKEIENPEHYQFFPTTTISSTGEYAGGGELVYDNRSAEGEEDLVYAFSGRVQHDVLESIKPVPLTFNHLLSQVTFEFGNDMTQRTTLEIENLNFIGGAISGNIELTQGLENSVWVPSNEKLTISNISTDDIAYNKATISEPSYIIPTNNEREYQIQFTVVVKNGGNEMARYPHLITLPRTDFVMGHSYKFRAVLSPENINPDQQLKPIEFTVDQVNTWQPDKEVIIPLAQM